VIVVSLRMRVAILMLVTADLMIFSRITLLPLIAMAIGAATILLGIVASYRTASVLGLLITLATAAASIEIPSLLELGAILMAIIALLIPSITLTWLTLSAEEGEKQQVAIRKRAAGVTLAFALVCVWSTPLVILVLSLFAPTVSMRADILAEISIMLITTIAGAVLLMRKRPTTTITPRPEGGST